MSEQPSLHEMLHEAVLAYCEQAGGGIPTGLLFAVQLIGSDGGEKVHIGCLPDQTPLVSAGLSRYIELVVEAEIEHDIYECDCPEDDE